MNKRIIQILVIVVLALMALYIILRPTVETNAFNLHNLTKIDTALIDKIVLHDGETRHLLLARSSNSWLVNQQFKAESRRVNLLLATLKQLVIKSPVSLQLKDSIVNQLRTQGVKVELYSKGKQLHRFFVDGSVANNTETYLMVSQANEPFWVELPGASGDFSQRFSIHETYWKGQLVFNYDLTQIVSLTVQYPNEPENSFSLVRNKSEFVLYNLQNKQPVVGFDTLETELFLNEFRFKRYHAKINRQAENELRVVLSDEPFCRVMVETSAGQKQHVAFYEKPGHGKTDIFGQQLKIDPDYFYLQTGVDELFIGQYYEFDPILRSLQSFLKE
ncbi:MAG: hypothetical protein AB7E36_05145 [Salinivirgaceae bacterium]